MEPGIVDTEPQSKIPGEEARSRVKGTRAQIECLAPHDVASVVAYAVSLPPRVILAEISVLPHGSRPEGEHRWQPRNST
jgi:NADP-dependent 3-hydroxy acid dehydrogenase YdfG